MAVCTWLSSVQIVAESLLSSIELSNITAVLSSAHLRDVLNMNSVCVCALSVDEDGCVQYVWYWTVEVGRVSV